MEENEEENIPVHLEDDDKKWKETCNEDADVNDSLDDNISSEDIWNSWVVSIFSNKLNFVAQDDGNKFR